MPLLKLIGLALFITAVFLALAAGITKTTHIRFQTPGTSNAPTAASDQAVLPPPLDSGFGYLPQADSKAMQFTSVPIVWPLVIAAGVGLLMWFMLSSDTPRTSYSTQSRSRRHK